jgi:uncharacterized membrane protein YdjX (TVP38/TMEM64 family)/Fe-S oxidoreductase
VTATSKQEIFLAACTSCGSCLKSCPFLASYGTPDQIIAASPADAFLCTDCGACHEACPLGLDPAEALRQTKQTFVKRGTIPSSAEKALAGARSFAETGHHFPFRHYPATATVFWPGCGLTGTSPAAVKKIGELLEKRLAEPVGIVLDCCFDPVDQIGDADSLQEALDDIKGRLLRMGIGRIVTGCLSCHKQFVRHFPDIKIDFVLDLLTADINCNRLPPTLFLHHPCPAIKFAETRRNLENRLAGGGAARIKDSLAACCGNGGRLPALAKDLSRQFAKRIIAQADGLPIVTYCTGCSRQFREKGRAAQHLFSFLPGVKQLSPVTMTRHWLNRFFLSAQLHFPGAASRPLPTKKWPAGLLIAVLIALGIILNEQDLFPAEHLLTVLKQYPVAAPLLFMAIYALAPSLMLPSIPLTLAAGFLWGPVWGVVFSIVGATIGSCLPFLLSRHLLSGLVRKRFNPDHWAWLEEKVARHGWKAVAFTRLIPVFPFNILNYLFGLTPIPFRHYLVSTFLFMLPACIAFVAFGSSLGALLLAGSMHGVMLGLAVAFTAILLTLAFKPYFRKMITKDEEIKPPPAGREDKRHP